MRPRYWWSNATRWTRAVFGVVVGLATIAVDVPLIVNVFQGSPNPAVADADILNSLRAGELFSAFQSSSTFRSLTGGWPWWRARAAITEWSRPRTGSSTRSARTCMTSGPRRHARTGCSWYMALPTLFAVCLLPFGSDDGSPLGSHLAPKADGHPQPTFLRRTGRSADADSAISMGTLAGMAQMEYKCSIPGVSGSRLQWRKRRLGGWLGGRWATAGFRRGLR